MVKVLLCLFSLGSVALAQAPQGCTLSPPVLTLSTYQADRDTRGQLDIEVVCAQPTERYRLRLSGWQLTPQGDAVSRVGAGGGLRLELLGAAPGLTGQEWTGSQRLRFPLRIPAGQWGVAGGGYPGVISVSLEAAGG